jgi:membrane protease YdiL (CAAX protease family)
VGPLLEFFSITYTVTWTCFIAAVALSANLPTDAVLGPGIQALVFLGTIAPSLVALGLTKRAHGDAGVRALLGRLFDWQVSARWYVFAAGYMVAIKLAVALVHRLVTGQWPRFGGTAWYVMAAAIVVSTWVQAGEEIGWRGYALPRLAARFGLGRASIVLGVVWACWHLPLFFLRGADTYGQSFVVYLLQVIALSVAMAWLYGRTHGSLLLVMLMHAAINNTKDIVPSAVPGATNALALSPSLVAWLTVALLWLGAGYFLVRMPRAALQRAGAV